MQRSGKVHTQLTPLTILIVLPHSPAGITGAFKPLVPIIVVCTNRKDADLIFETIQPVSFTNVAPDDAHTMIYTLQHEPVTTIQHRLQVKSPMFAIPAGVEPGIYIGFDWYVMHFVRVQLPSICIFCRSDVKQNIEGNIKGGRANWKGYPDGDLSAALIFMLKKPGAKLPLVPAGVPFPPPPPRSPVKELRFDLSNLSLGSGGEGEEDGQGSGSTSAASGKRGGNVSRAASPTKRAPAKAAVGSASSASSASQDDIVRRLPTRKEHCQSSRLAVLTFI